VPRLLKGEVEKKGSVGSSMQPFMHEGREKRDLYQPSARTNERDLCGEKKRKEERGGKTKGVCVSRKETHEAHKGKNRGKAQPTFGWAGERKRKNKSRKGARARYARAILLFNCDTKKENPGKKATFPSNISSPERAAGWGGKGEREEASSVRSLRDRGMGALLQNGKGIARCDKHQKKKDRWRPEISGLPIEPEG